MKKLIFLIYAMQFIGVAKAQVLKVSTGTSLTILAGTVFKVDSLTLTPSGNFTLNDITLSKSATAIHTPINTYIQRVYQFSSNSNPFSGSVQMNYNDGAELNGIPENLLTLNIYNGSYWNETVANTRNGINNFVISNSLSNIILNEITLANHLNPLPLTWLSFKATKENQTVLIQWATAYEQNTKSFTVKHSSDGINWTNISNQAATGFGNTGSRYSYVHANPIIGSNFYQIMQTDRDEKFSYSEIRSVKFLSKEEPFSIMANPVINDILIVQINAITTIALYTAEGKLLWQEHVNAGTKNIDVSGFAKGIYLIKANTTTQKIVIQ